MTHKPISSSYPFEEFIKKLADGIYQAYWYRNEELYATLVKVKDRVLYHYSDINGPVIKSDYDTYIALEQISIPGENNS